MSRTRLLPVAVACLLAFTPRPVRSDAVNQINGIGMIDYSRGAAGIHVGDWAKYHMTAKSELGVTDDYTVTVMIAGEEEWWGDPGFWVETWTETPGEAPRTAATLMSYAIFKDSLAVPHMQLYMRKTITGLKDDGTPNEDVYKRAAQSMKTRDPVGTGIRWHVDTLGTETVKTVKGEFPCTKIKIEQGTGATAQGADSALYTEVRETRFTYLTPRIPLTGIAREDIDYGAWRKTWLIGRSGEGGAMRTMDHSKGTAALVDFGSGGLAPKLVPARWHSSLAEQRAAAARAAPAKPAARTAAKKATAAKP